MRIVWIILGCYAIAMVAVSAAMMQGCSNMRMDVVATGESSMKPAGCAECHQAIHAEWADSPHARAFTNAAFQQELTAHAQEQCTSCHAPQSILADGPLVARKTDRDLGVICQSCHMTSDCAMAGPNPAFDLHPVEPRQGFYRSSAMCGRCHESTYREWVAAPLPGTELQLVRGKEFGLRATGLGDVTAVPDKKTCQECHMQPVTRRQTDKKPFDTLHPAYEGRTHIFSATHEELAHDAVSLKLTDASADADGLHLVVEATNVKAMHNVPTGAFGHRELDIVAELTDADGKVIADDRHALLADLHAALAPGEQRSIELALRPTSPGQQVRLRAERVDRTGQVVALLGSADGTLSGRVEPEAFVRFASDWARPREDHASAPAEDHAPAVRTGYRKPGPGPLTRILGDLNWGWRQLCDLVAAHPDASIILAAIGLAVLYLRRVIRRGHAS